MRIVIRRFSSRSSPAAGPRPANRRSRSARPATTGRDCSRAPGDQHPLALSAGEQGERPAAEIVSRPAEGVAGRGGRRAVPAGQDAGEAFPGATCSQGAAPAIGRRLAASTARCVLPDRPINTISITGDGELRVVLDVLGHVADAKPRPAGGWPNRRISPRCGVSSPRISFTSVVLPPPLGPTMHTA